MKKVKREDRAAVKNLAAVESGEAHGWHTLVYGMTLVLDSLPQRQGLLGYAHQTTRGFIHVAARSLNLSEVSCRDLFEEICAPLPERVEVLVKLEPVESIGGGMGER